MSKNMTYFIIGLMAALLALWLSSGLPTAANVSVIEHVLGK